MKTGLSLGGGGAKGAYQVGILKAFEEENIIDLIDIYSGVSIGAINAYFYLNSNSFNTVYNSWIYGINNNPLKEESLLKRNKEYFGLYNIDILKEIANKFLDEQTFKTTNKDLYVVLTKVKQPSVLALLKKENREKVIIHLNEKKDPLDYVISSATVPVLFGFKEIEGNFYTDGGITDNNPIDVLVEKGAKVIFHSSFIKDIDYSKYEDKNITFIELTSMYALPELRLKRFLASANFDLDIFTKRVDIGYYVGKSMIKYLKEINVLTFKDNKYVFNDLKESLNIINIPDYIHEEVKKIYHEK